MFGPACPTCWERECCCPPQVDSFSRYVKKIDFEETIRKLLRRIEKLEKK